MAEAPKIPQIVRERLRVQAGVPVGAEHLDADILTAFAENALPVRERSLVMNHLAVCGSCREIVILSQPVAVESSDAAQLPASRARRWMAFRWAALAACFVLTVGVLLLERSFRLSPAEHAAPVPAPPAAAAPVSPDMQSKMEAEPTTAGLTARNEKPADKRFAREKRERAEPGQRGLEAYGYADMKANSIGRPYDGSKDYYSTNGTIGRLGKQPATKEEDSDRTGFSAPGLTADKMSEMHRSAPTPGVVGGTVGGPLAKAKPSPPAEARTGFVLVPAPPSIAATSQATDLYADREQTAASHPASQEPGKKKVADEPLLPATAAASRQRVLPRDDKGAVAQSLTMSAQSSSSNFKFEAKDQPETLTSNNEKLATASSTPVQWRIRGGKLQQSNDQGKTWQEVAIPPGISLRAFWSLGNNVWAGGTEGSLFRITEAGKNSVRIPIKIGEGDVSQTVVAVTFSDELHGIITLENGQILQTADGGKTWVRH
jgi:hypothetical protein